VRAGGGEVGFERRGAFAQGAAERQVRQAARRYAGEFTLQGCKLPSGSIGPRRRWGTRLEKLVETLAA
jgi:hypothetical protein